MSSEVKDNFAIFFFHYRFVLNCHCPCPIFFKVIVYVRNSNSKTVELVGVGMRQVDKQVAEKMGEGLIVAILSVSAIFSSLGFGIGYDVLP